MSLGFGPGTTPSGNDVAFARLTERTCRVGTRGRGTGTGTGRVGRVRGGDERSGLFEVDRALARARRPWVREGARTTRRKEAAAVASIRRRAPTRTSKGSTRTRRRRRRRRMKEDEDVGQSQSQQKSTKDRRAPPLLRAASAKGDEAGLSGRVSSRGCSAVVVKKKGRKPRARRSRPARMRPTGASPSRRGERLILKPRRRSSARPQGSVATGVRPRGGASTGRFVSSSRRFPPVRS